MFKITTVNGARQLANVSGPTPIIESEHEGINEMLVKGIVSESAVEQWAVLELGMDVQTSLSVSELPTFTSNDQTEYTV